MDIRKRKNLKVIGGFAVREDGSRLFIKGSQVKVAGGEVDEEECVHFPLYGKYNFHNLLSAIPGWLGAARSALHCA